MHRPCLFLREPFLIARKFPVRSLISRCMYLGVATITTRCVSGKFFFIDSATFSGAAEYRPTVPNGSVLHFRKLDNLEASVRIVTPLVTHSFQGCAAPDRLGNSPIRRLYVFLNQGYLPDFI
jgi:hypothetical protein